MRPALLPALLALLALPATALAAPPRRAVAAKAPHAAKGELRFLGSTPGGPLAVVRHGEVQTPAQSACRSWAPLHSHWRALDAFGRIVGEVAVRALDYYDVSKCDELSFRKLSGEPGAGLYVDVRAPYRAPDVRFWRPDAASFASLERVVRARQARVKVLRYAGDEKKAPSMRALAFFFARGPKRERYAAVGGPSLVVLRRKGDAWVVVHEERPPKNMGLPTAYRVLGVTDMNGDGRPELVVHEKESFGEWYGDGTFTQDADGTWKRIGPGIFGSTA